MFSNHNEEMQKIYILENKIWKNEIIKYINSGYNRKYYFELIKNNNFIIRNYDCTDYKREQRYIHTLLKNRPNIAEIYLMIKKRDLPLLNNNRKELIDIEKKYETNISGKIFDNKNIKDFLTQMIYCQINLFSLFGIVHNNIHEGNIFMENNDNNLFFTKSDDAIEYIYNNKTILYKHIDKYICSNVRYILSDFTKCRIYDSKYSSGICDYYDYNISILKNLEDTFFLGNKLYESNFQINLNVPNDIIEKYKEIFKNYKNNDNNIDNNLEITFNYYEEKYKKFNNEAVKLCWEYVEPIIEFINHM